MGGRARGDAGQAGVVVLVSLVLILAVAGLAIDGGALVAGKVGLLADADAAARAGAGAISQATLASTGQAVLLPAEAEDRARAYATTVCPSCTVSVSADTGSIRVSLQRAQSTFFLQAVGIRSVDIVASSSANPVAR